jgi:hypothetical protein
MSGNDQMTDGAELRELRHSLSGVAMPERPRLEAITAGAARAGVSGSPQSRACPWPAPPLVPHWPSA